MANLNNLAMGNSIANDSRISTKASFFNLYKKHFYTPTQSPVKAQKKEYSPTDGVKLENALNCKSPKERAAHIAALDAMNEVNLGNYLLEMCYSDDRQFCALQLNQFKQLRYEPVTPVCTFEGEEARTVVEAL